MKLFLLVTLFVLSFYVGYVGMRFIDGRISKGKVLALKTEENLAETIPTVTFTPSPFSTSTPTATPIPTNTNTPTPTIIAQPIVTSEEIHKLMDRFAGQYGVDVNILRHIATCESGFNSTVVNGPYGGLYQFNVNVWKNNRVLMGEDPNPDLRFNAEESTQTAAYLISKGKRSLWPNCYP